MKFRTIRGPLAIIASVATVAGLAACSPADTASQGDTSGERTSVTIQIDGAAVPYYAPLYEAAEQGYFEEAGLDVEFTYAEASSVLQNVAAGNVQFGFPNGDSVITAKANGVDVEVVHTTYQQGIGAVLFNKETNPITKPEDLKGKTVAVTDLGSPNYIQLQAMLADAGMSVSDLNVVTVGSGSIVAALQNGEVDAIVFSRLRYFALESAGFPVGQMLSDKYLPSFGNVLVTSPSLRESDPEVVSGFVSALDKGIQYVIDNTEAAVTEVIAKYSDSFAGQEESITQVITDVFVADLWQSEFTKEHGLGYGDLEKWQAAIDAQVSFGLINESYDASSLVVEPGDL
ncbi:NitT/TauT family transport system substrate-binding protein [Homoserinimonas aerilata]|uniref:NitT/TauT family transport system substrate-binding protein n=1 Tax=Homoserinimonas aerilata TaxID=1162970 RepID=A0A542YA09_9MICO|nr:ABC transporter substrate-binding protein [Homoserinimonas aerilata]TQL44928.1 NitT/TauT family transport system substrate-binding protein [Homoserinimonas aerilata]